MTPLLALACTAGLWLRWDASPEPDVARYDVMLNGVTVASVTEPAAYIGTGCGIACVRAVDGAGNAGGWSCLLDYGPCAVRCGGTLIDDLEADGCCPVSLTPWWHP